MGSKKLFYRVGLTLFDMGAPAIKLAGTKNWLLAFFFFDFVGADWRNLYMILVKSDQVAV